MDEKTPIDTSKLAAASAVAGKGTSVDPNAGSLDSGAIDFDQLSMGTETPVAAPVSTPEATVAQAPVPSENVEAVPVTEQAVPITEEQQTQSSISQVNALLQEEEKGPEIDISNIQIEEMSRKEQKKGSKILGDSGIGKDMLNKVKKFNYWKVFSISVAVMIVSILASGVLFAWTKYITIVSQPKLDVTYQTYVDYAKDYQKLWSQYTNLNDYYLLATSSLEGVDAAATIDNILDSDRLSYIHKKDIFQNSLNGLSNDIVMNSAALDTIKKDITRYGFFPKDIGDIFGDEKQDISIKKSLISLEVVKFSTAIKVFSYLDTFIKGLANLVNLSPDQVQKNMQDLYARGEKDIKIYLNTCYLNPYEVDESCALVGDFDAYYPYYDADSAFDVSFFKKLMYYIDLKLEQSDLPSFSIVFQKFDPKQKQISFDVEVNTFLQDEASLIGQGITNPHIFVVTQLLDLLKQSLFVIGENIDAKQLKIQPKVIEIGSTVFTVNSSSLSFVLPIQKNPQREIADYILDSDFYFAQDSKKVQENVIIEETENQNIEVSTGSTEELKGTGTVESPVSIQTVQSVGIIE